MRKILALLYGGVAYVVFFGTFLYLIGFVANLYVPKSIDTGTMAPRNMAIITDLVLVALFGLQHTIMARPAFKGWWTKVVPAPVERTTYVLFTSLILMLMMWLWRPLPDIIWQVDNEIAIDAIQAFFWLGWAIILLSTFAIDHFDLFGLRQVFRFARGQEQTPVGYKEHFFYRIVRHPLMLGFLIAFWAATTMSVGHLLFAASMTVYILIALQFEEHDLVAAHGDSYKDYQRRVSMLIPLPKGSKDK